MPLWCDRGLPFRDLAHHGFFATTLPFSHTYIGVPCIRAVLRATLAALRSARPTACESALVVFFLLVVFMGLPPAI